ncbi:MAG: HPr(Ser) kinase/phosphatase [candidate division WOR-3 bacterium]
MKEFENLKVYFNEVRLKNLIKILKERFNIVNHTPELKFNTIVQQADLNRPALLLKGFEEIFLYDRIQIIGETELLVLKSLNKKEREKAIKRFFSYPIPAIFVTKGFKPPEDLLEEAKKNKVPLFSVSEPTTLFMREIFFILSLLLSPYTVLHGNIVNVYNVGILFIGRSGIGKSECSLELVERGHKLVGDDLVKIIKHPENFLIGEAFKEDVRTFLEIRGIGILDIISLFGPSSCLERTKIDIIIRLIDWSETLDIERIGLKEKKVNILGINIPYVELPLNPGKHISVLVEAVALNYLTKERGEVSAEKFLNKLKGKKL